MEIEDTIVNTSVITPSLKNNKVDKNQLQQ